MWRRLFAQCESGQDYAWAVAGWFMLPVLAVFTFVWCVQDIQPTWDARQGKGITGSFTAQHVECTKTCSYYGDFVSDDGSVHYRDVLFSVGGIDGIGDAAEAIDSGTRNPTVVYAAHGSHTWIVVWLLIMAAVAYVACWAVAMVNTLRGGKPLTERYVDWRHPELQ